MTAKVRALGSALAIPNLTRCRAVRIDEPGASHGYMHRTTVRTNDTRIFPELKTLGNPAHPAAVDNHAAYVYSTCVHIRRGMVESDKPPQRIGVREFRGNLTGFLRQARQGRSFLVMSRDQVLAEVGPPPPEARPRRQPGALRGKIRMAPDFDALPSDTLAAMEGEEE